MRWVQALSASSIPVLWGDGDFLLFGHDNGNTSGTTTGIPTAYSGNGKLFERAWRVDLTGTPGSVSITFDLSNGGFGDPDNYELLLDSDGNFTNATRHTTGRSYNSTTNILTFTGVNFSDGDYFTLANTSNTVTSDATGNWTSRDTWACHCVPGTDDDAVIGNSTTVTLSSNVTINSVMITDACALTMSGSPTLSLVGSFSNGGTYTRATETVDCVGSSAQTLTNNTETTVAMYNLSCNNAAGVSTASGPFSVSNMLTVSSGTFSTTDALFTLESNASSTAIIPEVTGTGFSGTSFRIERFLSDRDAYWGAMASPMASMTINDWDDDIFISGIGGNNGNALGVYANSVKRYNESGSAYVNLTATSDALTSAVGYEVFLGNSLTRLNATTVDSDGTPNSGDEVATVTITGTDVNAQGWNLLGNPYAAHLIWDSVHTAGTNINSSFYVPDTSGNYSAFGNGNTIPPHQGFWVFCNPAGSSPSLTFKERWKSNTTSSSFFKTRQKMENEFVLKLSSDHNRFFCETSVGFDEQATTDFESLDLPFKVSPVVEAPMLNTSSGEGRWLLANTLNPEVDHHVVSMNLRVPEPGMYHLSNRGADLVDDYDCIILEDPANGTFVDLREQEDYHFRIDNGNEVVGLKIHFSKSNADYCKTATAMFTQPDPVQIFRSDNALILDFDFLEQDEFSVNILDGTGRPVQAETSFYMERGRKVMDLPSVAPGMYLVVVQSSRQQFVQRLVF